MYWQPLTSHSHCSQSTVRLVGLNVNWLPSEFILRASESSERMLTLTTWRDATMLRWQLHNKEVRHHRPALSSWGVSRLLLCGSCHSLLSPSHTPCGTFSTPLAPTSNLTSPWNTSTLQGGDAGGAHRGGITKSKREREKLIRWINDASSSLTIWRKWCWQFVLKPIVM